MAFIRLGDRWQSPVTLNLAAIAAVRPDGAVMLMNGDLIEYQFAAREGRAAQRAIERAIDAALASSTVVAVENP